MCAIFIDAKKISRQLSGCYNGQYREYREVSQKTVMDIPCKRGHSSLGEQVQASPKRMTQPQL